MRERETTGLSVINLLQEFRAIGEFAKFAGHAWTWPLGRAPKGRSILLIPGFLVGDATLYPFANWLRSRGHQVFFSGILANTECPRRVIERLSNIAIERHAQGGEKLVVIGHSLGGIYARTLGRRLPQCVEQVILLASPIKDPHKNSNPYIKILALLTRQIRDAGHKCGDQMATICGVHGPDAPLVPETLIYSRRDGVIDWTSCIEDGPQVSAFEVDSTHLGLPYNLDTLRIVRARVEKTRLQPSTPSATSPRPGL